MSENIFLNGINPLTGQYLVPPLTAEAASAIASSIALSADQKTAGQIRDQLSRRTLGLPFNVHPENIAEAGWAIVSHVQEDPAVMAALEPLFQHRLKQAGPALVKKLPYNGETFIDWLAGNNVAPGTVNPSKIPFYLLLIGDPDRMPFLFGHLLDIEYAVGRLHFDAAADYRQYVADLIEYETLNGVSNTKEVIFFGPEHINDEATRLSSEELIAPLADGADGKLGIAGICQFSGRKITGQNATKSALLSTLQRPAPQNPPAMLLTASHGLGWPSGDPLQPAAQGALLCADWKGLGFSPIPITADKFLSAADLNVGTNIRHMAMFHFACFGLGTPAADTFSFDPKQPPQQLAPKPFFSPLPKRMLSHPNGAALAVISHVDRAWATSISPPNVGPQIQPFQNVVGKILTGVPLGLALTDFSAQFGTYSALLDALLEKQLDGLTVDAMELAVTWVQRNDAEAYVLFGDPAIKLRLEKVQ